MLHHMRPWQWLMTAEFGEMLQDFAKFNTMDINRLLLMLFMILVSLFLHCLLLFFKKGMKFEFPLANQKDKASNKYEGLLPEMVSVQAMQK